MRLLARMPPRMNWENDVNISHRDVERNFRNKMRGKSDNHLSPLEVSATGEIWSFQPSLTFEKRMSSFLVPVQEFLSTCYVSPRMRDGELKKEFLFHSLFTSSLVEWLEERRMNRWIAFKPPNQSCPFPVFPYPFCRSLQSLILHLFFSSNTDWQPGLLVFLGSLYSSLISCHDDPAAFEERWREGERW